MLSPTPSRSTPRWRLVGVALCAAVLLAAAGCGEDEPETAVEAFDDLGERGVELVTGEPFEATALVDDVLGPGGFRLLDTLVVTAEPVDVDEGDRVRVTGEVEAAADVVRSLGDALDDEVRDALAEEDLVVLATEVAIVDADAVDDGVSAPPFAPREIGENDTEVVPGKHGPVD